MKPHNQHLITVISDGAERDAYDDDGYQLS